jgi:DNA (cytosine-5)-methyltransferase 1
MKVGSLFSGYGGLDMAVGGDLAWYAEVEPAACKVMAAHHHGVPNLGDVTRVDWSQVERVDVITAGYPCQPFSTAGNRKGKDDERHLWPHVRDAIGALGPSHVVLENVRGHLTLGFADVLADLADLGMSARWGVVRASDAGAPHGRARLFAVTYTAQTSGVLPQPSHMAAATKQAAEPRERDSGAAEHRFGVALHRWADTIGRPWPDPNLGDEVNPAFVEWLMGLPDGWVTGHGLSNSESLAMLGNGVVPQQAALALRLLGAA